MISSKKVSSSIIKIEKFLESWEKFPPSKMERFYFKHFSKNAENNKSSWLVALILIIPFLMGFIGTIADVNYNFIKIVTLTFSLMMVVFAIPWIYIWYAHNRRIKNIIKYLGCTMEEWNTAVDKWGKLIK